MREKNMLFLSFRVNGLNLIKSMVKFKSYYFQSSKGGNMEVKVIDSMMGSGKSESMIKLMNSSNEDEKFIYITPYLDEIDRIKSSCIR